jgi:hypothetical protein
MDSPTAPPGIRAGLRDLLVGTAAVVRTLEEHHVGQVGPNSLAACELEQEQYLPPSVWGDTPVRGVWAMAAVELSASTGHLVSLATMLESERDATLAPMVARDCLSAAALSWYLYDPGVELKDRVGRAWDACLEAQQAQRDLLLALDLDHPPGDLEVLLIASAAALGLETASDPPTIGPPRPSTLGRVGHFLADVMKDPVLATVAPTAEDWDRLAALLSAGKRAHHIPPDEPVADVSVRRTEGQAGTNRPWALLWVLPLAGQLRAASRCVSYFGRDTAPLDLWRRHVGEELATVLGQSPSLESSE